MILLTITFALGIILQNIWRRVVDDVLINISPSNILPIVLKPERLSGWFCPLWASMGQGWYQKLYPVNGKGGGGGGGGGEGGSAIKICRFQQSTV